MQQLASNGRPGPWKRRLRPSLSTLANLLVVLPWSIPMALAGDGTRTDHDREYAVKAAYLFNLAHFVVWPPDDEDRTFDLWVVGIDPFGEVLDQTVAGKTVSNKAFIVHRATNVEAIPKDEDIDIVFLAVDSPSTAVEWTNALGSGPVLIASEVPGHAAMNGVIGFYIVGNNVRFEINRRNALDRGLQISSQLLDLARIVGEGT